MTDAVETEEYVEPDYKAALTKTATSLQARFAEWLQGDEVGYNPAAAKTKKDAFEEGVRLGVALRIPYQASEHNRAATAEEKAEREAERQRAKQERDAAKAAREAATPAEEAPAPAPKPAKSAAAARKAAKAAPAGTPATAPAAPRPAARRAPARRPATPAATAGDAPF